MLIYSFFGFSGASFFDSSFFGFSTNYKMHIENIQKLKEINNEKYEN